MFNVTFLKYKFFILLLIITGTLFLCSTRFSKKMQEKNKSRIPENIFFLETSFRCDHGFHLQDGFHLSARQACSVESAARANPGMAVKVLFTSNLTAEARNPAMNSLLKKILKTYENISLKYINITEFSRNTPLEELVKSGKIEKSRHFVFHLSDVLRYLTLWKFGGTYLDLDVIVLKPLEFLGHNYTCQESENYISSAILNFEKGDNSNSIANYCVFDLKYYFNADIWSANGPGVITRVLRSICQTDKIDEMTSEKCRGVKLLKTDDCLNIHYPESQKLYREENLDEIMSRLNSTPFVHIWNHMGGVQNLSVRSRAPYVEIAKKYCPTVIQNCGETF